MYIGGCVVAVVHLLPQRLLGQWLWGSPGADLTLSPELLSRYFRFCFRSRFALHQGAHASVRATAHIAPRPPCRSQPIRWIACPQAMRAPSSAGTRTHPYVLVNVVLPCCHRPTASTGHLPSLAGPSVWRRMAWRCLCWAAGSRLRAHGANRARTPADTTPPPLKATTPGPFQAPTGTSAAPRIPNMPMPQLQPPATPHQPPAPTRAPAAGTDWAVLATGVVRHAPHRGQLCCCIALALTLGGKAVGSKPGVFPGHWHGVLAVIEAGRITLARHEEGMWPRAGGHCPGPQAPVGFGAGTLLGDLWCQCSTWARWQATPGALATVLVITTPGHGDGIVLLHSRGTACAPRRPASP